ncbi:hypothetical protein OQA88_7186 [Cercophora sp. LCS_1]
MSADRVNAVINAPEHQLRALVQALLTGDDDALRNKVLGTYFAIQNRDLGLSSEGTNKRKAEFDDDIPGNAPPADNVQSCVRCKESFLPSGNISGQDCLHHPGELLLDEDSQVWREWEYSEMDMDTMESRQDFPEGFKYACCGGAGTTQGCKRGYHVSRPKPRP